MLIVQSSPTGFTEIGQIGGGGISAIGIGPNSIASFTPVTTPLYSLDDDDFIVQESSVGTSQGVTAGGPALRSGATPLTGGFSDDPVHITRSTPADASNMIEIECLDRANSYNTEIAEAFDQASIDLYGVRRDTSVKARLIVDPSYVGPLVAQLLLQRQLLYRNTYSFRLGWKYCLLEPMDLVQISDARLGAAALTVRITAVEEDNEGMLSITAEDFFGSYSSTVLYPHGNFTAASSPSILGAGGATAPIYTRQPGGGSLGGYVPNWNSDPGNVNTPLIFEPPPALLSGDLEIWIALSGGPNWGGAQVWISSDGDSYAVAGQITGASTQGLTTADFPSYAGTNPDMADTLSVDLTESRGQLVSVSSTDAANLVTLCYVGGELVAYETANLTSAHHYNLATVYRGVYGSTTADHPSGAQFARLDNLIGRFPFPNTLVGQTIHLKFPSFNIVNGGLQNIASVSAYAYTVIGSGRATVTTAVPAGSVIGKPDVGATVQLYTFSMTTTLPAGLAGSHGSAGTAATASATFSIRKNGTNVGTMVFAASATTAVFTMSSATTFMPGDVLAVIAPSPQDTTLANLSWTFAGSH